MTAILRSSAGVSCDAQQACRTVVGQMYVADSGRRDVSVWF